MMEWFTSLLSTTYVLGSIPIILLVILAVTRIDGNLSRKSLMSWSVARPLGSLYSFLIEIAQPATVTTIRDWDATEIRESSSINVSKESDFPEGWWTGDEVFRLERRAIFSKVGNAYFHQFAWMCSVYPKRKYPNDVERDDGWNIGEESLDEAWLFIAHTSRFVKPGDYHAFEICGFPLFLIQGKDGIIRSFHNVCRHRAYPVISRKKSGSTTVMGCRYHGWSYDTQGYLIKAPQFECLEGFDKSQNSLFEIHTRITKHGFIFVNLDSRNDVAEPDLEVHAIDRFANANQISQRSSRIDGWEVEGRFNWKLAVLDMHGNNHSSARTNQESGNLRSVLQSMFSVSSRDQNGYRYTNLDVFPATSIHVTGKGGIWFSVSIVPMNVGRSSIRCDIYERFAVRNADRNHAVVADVKPWFVSEIAKLETAYKTLNAPGSCKTDCDNQLSLRDGMVARLHDNALQELILSNLKSHLTLERVQGEEIWPTVRLSSTSDKYKRANELCKELEAFVEDAGCSKGLTKTRVKDPLDW
ncbi:hypothetical protein PAAG_04583 [Paracoccidioides lutzii Pb01]|uniref:Rieske domain-containing protein n=1 Tax=Paracoccidioides lutzii (strain ATCC MYA-826 / Pb01) TaxID=502779 RepID=C1H1D9_PARBA|nr:hypothetical protein PAAG_04583 [Paracoccidioides lutzii Pb01]EEH33533.2 hypothetical protein PAAG_04583 [Paracoccidioides lutzii Pb01]